MVGRPAIPGGRDDERLTLIELSMLAQYRTGASVLERLREESVSVSESGMFSAGQSPPVSDGGRLRGEHHQRLAPGLVGRGDELLRHLRGQTHRRWFGGLGRRRQGLLLAQTMP